MATITHTLSCPCCESTNLRRWSITPPNKQGERKQRYRCNICTKTFRENYTPEKGDIPGFQEMAIAMYQERASMRGVARVLGISRNTLADWLKKSASNSVSSENSTPC
jgi:transposase-like protein